MHPALRVLIFATLTVTLSCHSEIKVQTVSTGEASASHPSEAVAGSSFNIVGPEFTNATVTDLSWQTIRGADSYMLKLSATPNCNEAFGLFQVQGPSAALDHLADGTYYACIDALDSRGTTVSTTQSAFRFVIDRTLPIVSLPSKIDGQDGLTMQASATDASPLTFGWTVLDGPGTLTFASSKNLATTVNASVSGSYRVKLTVTDGAGNVVSSITTVTVHLRPTHAAVSLGFTDTDQRGGYLGGTLTIGKASDESDVAQYVVYWGQANGEKVGLQPIASLPAQKTNLSLALSPATAIPLHATKFLVFTAYGGDEMLVPLGLSIVDKGVPAHAALGLSFVDADPVGGEVGGVLSITRAADESDVTEYRLYWADDTGVKIASTPWLTAPKVGTDLVLSVPAGTMLPVGATHFFVATANSDGEMQAGVSLPIVDAGVPESAALALSFTDTDPAGGELGGTLHVVRAADESHIDSYALYWGATASAKASAVPLAIQPKTGGDFDFALPVGTVIPTSPAAAFFLVRTVNASGEMATGAVLAFVDVGVPVHPATGAAFVDVDLRPDLIEGTLTVQHATDESDVTEYAVYWADGAGLKLTTTPLAVLSSTGSDTTVAIAHGTPVYSGAINFLILTRNADGEMTSGVTVPVSDKANITFLNTGADVAFTIPAAVTSLHVKAWGAGGSYSHERGLSGGGGAFVEADMPVTGGEALTLVVGSGGTVAFRSGSGGGRTAVQRAGVDLVTAAGGGAAGCIYPGGAGGGLVGQDADPGTSSGKGGTQTVGGLGGTGSSANGQNGSQFQGGAGASNTLPGAGSYGGGGYGGGDCGGGGGGGYFGGGGGAEDAWNDGGGGGGSSFVPSGGTMVAGAWQSPGNATDSDLPATVAQGGLAGVNAGGGDPGILLISY